MSILNLSLPGAFADNEDLPEPEHSTYSKDGTELRLFRWEQAEKAQAEDEASAALETPTAGEVPAPEAAVDPILLVHGIGMGHAVYDRFIAILQDHRDVIAVDLPGFGDSPAPEQAHSIPETADFLAEALRAQGVRSIVAAGHSMGAQVVAELSARHPDLVSRTVLIAPTVNAAERGFGIQALRMIEDFLRGKTVGVMLKGAVAYARTGPLWFAKKLRPTLEHRMERVLPRITQPTLVLCGSQDSLCPRPWIVRVTSLLADGQLRVLTERGHEALISSGEPAADIVLDWLEEVR
ncbi:alpha/beta fold hydrolase [Leucobacter sp. GX24907]